MQCRNWKGVLVLPYKVLPGYIFYILKYDSVDPIDNCDTAISANGTRRRLLQAQLPCNKLLCRWNSIAILGFKEQVNTIEYSDNNNLMAVTEWNQVLLINIVDGTVKGVLSGSLYNVNVGHSKSVVILMDLDDTYIATGG
jgi:hypothetical protein